MVKVVVKKNCLARESREIGTLYGRRSPRRSRSSSVVGSIVGSTVGIGCLTRGQLSSKVGEGT